MEKWGIEPIMYLLFAGVFLSVLVAIYVETKFKDDGQMFQMTSTLVVGFSSAFFARMSPKRKGKDGDG